LVALKGVPRGIFILERKKGKIGVFQRVGGGGGGRAGGDDLNVKPVGRIKETVGT